MGEDRDGHWLGRHAEVTCAEPNCGRSLCRIGAVGIRVLQRAVSRIPVNFGDREHDDATFDGGDP